MANLNAATNTNLVKAPLTSPEEVLAALTDLLSCSNSGAPLPSPRNYDWSDIPWEHSCNSRTTNQGCEMDGDACDFSSFPSLSLQKKVRAVGDITTSDQILFHGKGGIEAHVAALLARPVLVGSGQEGKGSATESDDESSEFMEAGIADLPSLLQDNLVLSFSTLLQSRLRAYTTFLARHGLSMAKSKSMKDLEESAAVVNQKLETMLEIGTLVSLNDVRTSFATKTKNASPSCDQEDFKTSLPVSMTASIQVAIPRLFEKAEVLSVEIEVAGTITGIFSAAADTPLLDVVQLDLNMQSLLDQLKKGAAQAVSRIVDITNTGLAFDKAHVPHSGGCFERDTRACGKRSLSCTDASEEGGIRLHVIPEDPSVMTPELRSIPASGSPSNFAISENRESDLSMLSPDKCGQIVDFLFDEMDVTVLTPPSKRAKHTPNNGADISTLFCARPPIA